MPDENTNPAAVAAPVVPPMQDVVPDVPVVPPVVNGVSDVPVADTVPAMPLPNPVVVEPTLATPAEVIDTAPVSDIQTEIVRKIGEAKNVLIALSSDPSVDEMAAAIGLSLSLDKMGKRATAIYSGATPNALEFLKPEETFESTADALQDFVIALNKDKADHLRYKLDGDFVKIYITPYKTKITEEDLDFSYGDFNVDLVLALDVANGVDLDSALREHGRIMHDASIVNITTGNPGKLGEIEWSDKGASSVSEMIARLLYNINGTTIEKEEATAFLTGIVAATNRFSNASTTPDTMKLASRLMESGANQQLISKNITPDVENEMINMLAMDLKEPAKKVDNDPTKLDIEHGNEEGVDESKEVDTEVKEKTSTLLDDLKAAEASLAQAGDETVPDSSNEPLKIESNSENNSAKLPELEVPEGIEEEAKAMADGETGTKGADVIDVNDTAAKDEQPNDKAAEVADNEIKKEDAVELASSEIENKIEPQGNEKVVKPSADFGADKFETVDDGKYGQMLEDALASVGGATEPTAPIMSPSDNPAAASTPNVPDKPEINGVPEINYMPMPGDEILPPPPAPMPLGPQPAMQDQVYNPQAVDPNAFKIPGM